MEITALWSLFSFLVFSTLLVHEYTDHALKIIKSLWQELLRYLHLPLLSFIYPFCVLFSILCLFLEFFLILFLYHSIFLLYVVLISFSAFSIFFSPQVELQILVLFFSHYWLFIKSANGMKMWKGNGSATTLLFSLKILEIVNKERRGQVKTIVMEHFNG